MSTCNGMSINSKEFEKAVCSWLCASRIATAKYVELGFNSAGKQRRQTLETCVQKV
jgi:hypothetical protein